jgi:hypothetical protein
VTDDTAKRLARLKEAWEKSTQGYPGKVTAGDFPGCGIEIHKDDGVPFCHMPWCGGIGMDEARKAYLSRAEFIALAHNEMPWLTPRLKH